MSQLKNPSLIFIFSLILINLSCARVMYKPQLISTPSSINWAKKVLNEMTLEEKIGQMVIWQYTGGFFNRDSDYLKDLESLIVKHHIGNLILFGGEVYETARLTNTLQKMAKFPLLIASDFERGAGNQISRATLFPPLMALGATNSEEMAYLMGRITAIEGRTMGIHMTYAPVVDVNSNPLNPIINTRSIGENPEQVSRLAVAFIKGCQNNGLIATAKHFPGHGDADKDSHIQLPVIMADREHLDKIELYPFKRAIEGGVEAIMTAHLYVPALDPTPGLPATLSPLILTELLRKEIGFKGLIITDALTMYGILDPYPAVKAVQAGADLILLPPDLHGAIDDLIQAVHSGEIQHSRINASVKRILEAKARLGLHKNRIVKEDSLATLVASKEFLQIAEKIFENSITLVKNEGDVLPLQTENRKIAAFSLSSDPGDYFAGRTFIREIQKRCPQVVSFYADPYTGQEYIQEGKAKAEGADTIIIALFSRLIGSKGSVDLDPKHIQLVKDFAQCPSKIVVISFGSPYFLTHFPEIDSYLCAYRYADQAQIAAAKALFGEIDIKGKLPVTLPDLYPFGHGITILKKAKTP